jgi:hypothetical protein
LGNVRSLSTIVLNLLTAFTLRFLDPQCVPPDPQCRAPAEHITKQQVMIVGTALPVQPTPVKARAFRAPGSAG